MNKSDRIYVAGHKGMVGSAIVRKLQKEGFNQIITRTSSELDLRKQHDVQDFFESERPAFVFLAAAKVGGILSNNTYRADFLYDNLMIETNVIHSSFLNQVEKLMFLGSSCIYPKFAPQPMKEEYLLTGTLEPTNEPYSIAKIAGIKLCEAYRDQHGCNYVSAMPTNLYGPNDNYHALHSHVLPALLKKFDEAKQNQRPHVTVWGTGTPRREFLHADDFADACVFLMMNYHEKEFVNVGCGMDISIKDLAFLIRDITGYRGEIHFDHEKPDGTPRKLLDVSKLTALGWKPRITLEEGIANTYEQFKNNFSQLRH